MGSAVSAKSGGKGTWQYLILVRRRVGSGNKVVPNWSKVLVEAHYFGKMIGRLE